MRDEPLKDPVAIRTRALDLLARREHSVAELRAKLRRKGADDEEALERILAELVGEGLLSDRRFAEAFARARVDRGQGSLRITMELRQREVDDECIEAALDAQEADWQALARAARHRRFGGDPPDNHRERARQARFLRYRGFTEAQVRAVLDDL